MMVYDTDGMLGKRMQYGLVHLQLDIVFPDGQCRPRNVAHNGNCSRQIVALFVQEVTAYLSDSVPEIC